MHAAFVVNIFAGIHVVNGEAILPKCIAAKINAENANNTAIDVNVIELSRKNVKQCSRILCRGIRRNSMRISPKMPDNTS